jgi:hypothetical protein
MPMQDVQHIQVGATGQALLPKMRLLRPPAHDEAFNFRRQCVRQFLNVESRKLLKPLEEPFSFGSSHRHGHFAAIRVDKDQIAINREADGLDLHCDLDEMSEIDVFDPALSGAFAVTIPTYQAKRLFNHPHEASLAIAGSHHLTGRQLHPLLVRGNVWSIVPARSSGN